MDKYNELVNYRQKMADLGKALSLMHWDQEVMMPEKGSALRARQLATLSGMYHNMSTSKEYEQLIKEARENHLDKVQERNVTLSAEEFEKSTKFSQEFVERQSRTISEAYNAWVKSREQNDFQVFLPKLKEIIELKKEAVEIIGYNDHPYDALLEEYERGLRVKDIDPIFEGLKKSLKEILDKVQQQQKPDSSFLNGKFEKEKQMELSRKVAKDLGYDFKAGRLDLSEHPFSTNFGSQDARITTRTNDSDFTESFGSTIHEVGHALYEQGQNIQEYGMFSGTTQSLSIHESQSRLWENNVGLSRPFIETYFPLIKEFFPEMMENTTAEMLFRAMNIVQPSLIRTAADEITYHFHIIIRYEIEKAIFEGKLQAEDLREAWIDKYKEYLGVDVPDDKRGVLQDIHWSHGSFGYFPTYSLGSLYAAQFFHFAKKEIGDFDSQIRNKDFSHLLNWLRKNIHSRGGIYTATELCEIVTGEQLNFTYFSNYIKQKLSDVYQVNF